MRPAAVELLRALARVLARRRWYLFGAQAVALHGLPRMTADVDVTLEVARSDLGALVARLQRAGFQLRVSDIDEFLRATSVLPLVHRKTGMPLDIVLAGSGLEALFLERAMKVDVGGVVVPVISPADLVVAKILAGRPKDIDDAVGVLREQRGKLRLADVRHLVSECEAALDQSDLTPALERAIRASRPERRSPRARPKKKPKQPRRSR